jgi:thiol-disulfide isomerase/thioredoxin
MNTINAFEIMKKSILLAGSISVILFLTSSSPQEHQTIQDKPPKVGLKAGKIAPEIELYTPDSTLVRLSDLRGSMVLIDFWASWCKGCRTMNKRVKPVFEKYHNEKFKNGNGFIILSICMDTDRDRWLNGIQEDSLQNYINVSDLKGMDSELAKKYNLPGLPWPILIDGSGIIMELNTSLNTVLEQNLLKE